MPQLDRARCRRHVEEHFSATRMVDDYLHVYRDLLGRSMREDHRPWGFYRILEDAPGHKVKRIQVHPGKRLSLQKHRRRSEHWAVVAGEGWLTLGEESRLLTPGDAADIACDTLHRMENRGTEPLVFIEVQRGDYLGEDDIERVADDFGRSDDRAIA